MKANHLKNYNSEVLVEIWGDFIDWKKRRIGEAGFIPKTLKKFDCHKIFDSCVGDGVDSIDLIKEGFNVTSNDLDKLFIKKAKENAEKHHVSLKITEYNWLDFNKHFKQETFDAVLCLGNSLTYLFEKKDQIKTLKNFLFILRKKGILIIDERNYQDMLDKRKEILGKGKFCYSKKYVYCGDKVHGKPVEISDNKIKMEYINSKTEKKGFLVLYPFKKGELLNLLKEAGFKKIGQFSDYKKGYNPKADFYHYICIK